MFGFELEVGGTPAIHTAVSKSVTVSTPKQKQQSYWFGAETKFRETCGDLAVVARMLGQERVRGRSLLAHSVQEGVGACHVSWEQVLATITIQVCGWGNSILRKETDNTYYRMPRTVARGPGG